MAWQKQFMRAGAGFDFVSKAFMTLEIEQQEPIPDEAILMAANHRSLLDVFVSLICCYRLKRPTRFIVGKSFFKKPGMGWFLRSIGCIEGGRKSGADLVAIEQIRSGVNCAIMPEGAIKTMQPGHIMAPLLPGVSTIWEQAACPFVAVGISGAQQVWPDKQFVPKRPHFRKAHRPIVHVRLTEAIRPDGQPCTLERIAEIMEHNCVVSEADRVAKLAAR